MLLLVAFFSGTIVEAIQVTSSTGTGSVMKSGETFELSCSSNQPWFLCIWEGPGGLSCQCQTEEGGVGSFCGQDSRMHLSGSSSLCTMTINNVRPEDAGRYIKYN